MGSKTLFFFCISLAIVLTITSQVAARELAETSTTVDNPKTLETRPAYGAPVGGGQGGDPGGWHRDGGYGRGGGGRYGGYPGQAVDAEP
nr:glycine-rich protein HC1-like [Coffea arabica]